MEWDTFYERFYDWAESTQISRISSLESFGSSEEVTEIALNYGDENVASRFIKKAVSHGVDFTLNEIIELSGVCNTETVNLLAESSKHKFTQSELDELCGIADDDVLERIAKKNNIRMLDDDEAYADNEPTLNEKSSNLGCLAALFGIITLSGSSKRKNGKCSQCDGDCKSCPPHYGYRYGRWYYGHSHTHGCERGGNKADGGRD